MVNSIKILDCTLRDGGYIIDWDFGKKNIISILDSLGEAHIDYIEAGFLKENIVNENKTFWKSVEEFTKYTKENRNYTLMVNFGEYSIKNFSKCNTPNIKIRVAFKKHNQNEVLEYIGDLKEMGWDVFVNPMSTNTYSDEELADLVREINDIRPYCLSIVDTLGNIYEAELVSMFKFIDKNLHKNIAVDFHSHNNIQLSFSNTEALIKSDIKRDLIIDSCLYGMGRGAGNLCTELITKYLNDNFGAEYDVIKILKVINDNIKPMYNRKPWGYSLPYFIAAIHGCHPNYAGFLVDLGLSEEKIDRIMRQIPQHKKTVFDKELIASLL